MLKLAEHERFRKHPKNFAIGMVTNAYLGNFLLLLFLKGAPLGLEIAPDVFLDLVKPVAALI